MSVQFSMGLNGFGGTWTEDSSLSAKTRFRNAVKNNPSAIGVGFSVVASNGKASVESERGFSPVDQTPVKKAIAGFAGRVPAGSVTRVQASGPVSVDELAPGAHIRVAAGQKLELVGTGDYRLPAYVSAESKSPAHSLSLGIQASVGKGRWTYEMPLTGKTGSFEIEVCTPFATHSDIWNASKLSHMTAGLSADSTYKRKRLWVDVEPDAAASPKC